MKAQYYREMGNDERMEKLKELQKRLFELNFQSVTEKLENTKAIKNIKHDIARVKTIMHENK